MADTSTQKILEDFITLHEADCPMCRHPLSGSSTCPGCNEQMNLDLARDETWTDLGLNRRWCILFIPWFLMCYMAAAQWVAIFSGVLFRGERLVENFGLPQLEIMSVIQFSSGWLQSLSPVICLLLWCSRTRINHFPGWLIWAAFGAGVLIWVQMLYWPVSMLWI